MHVPGICPLSVHWVAILRVGQSAIKVLFYYTKKMQNANKTTEGEGGKQLKLTNEFRSLSLSLSIAQHNAGCNDRRKTKYTARNLTASTV